MAFSLLQEGSLEITLTVPLELTKKTSNTKVIWTIHKLKNPVLIIFNIDEPFDAINTQIRDHVYFQILVLQDRDQGLVSQDQVQVLVLQDQDQVLVLQDQVQVLV